ncbi:MAG TPA: LON peptidase substrate-binding domain-containing protein [Streptosporangiaceae bacterium]|nr:LON peptidase substrate-binding domain-containing protein [Streptosporangiaceae bacterium]
MATETLPLFPLGTVLYPGLVLPLNIFEERYRQLVRDLLDGPEPRRFGVIAIREGRETGIDGVSALYDVGCLATVRDVTELPDGRYELVTVGTDRFKLHGLDESRPYLRGEVELLDEQVGDEAEVKLAVAAVQRGFRGYLDVLAAKGSATISVPELPDEPILLSYLVAASVIIDLPERQGLLAQPSALRRLRSERALLAKETAILRSLGSMPAPDLRSSPYSQN